MTNIPVETPPFNSWQFWRSCRKILGETFLNTLYNRSVRQIYRWAADPRFTESNERNPIDRLGDVFERLEELGRDDVAIAALRILADKIGCEVVCQNMAEPDQETIEAECLDDYPALINFHDAIRKKAPPEELRHLWQEAKGELDETYQVALRGK